MDTLTTANAALAGFFACAALHYAVHWWLSRHERVLLLFSVQCAAYTMFSLAIIAFFRATTIADSQATLDRFVTLGVIVHILSLHLYADLGGRRDRVFRALITGALAFLVIRNQWAPIRGTVLELRTMSLPWGGTGLLPIRTPPGAALAMLYVLVLTIQAYGFFVARAIWMRDRAGTILLAIGSTAILAGAGIGFLVDFAKLRAPFSGALPHVVNVLCVSFFLSREYAARAARVAGTNRQFEAAFEHGPIGKALLAVDGRFLRVNRALCRVLGWTADELGARRLRDVTHPDDLGSDEVELGRLRDVSAYTVERRLLRKDGEPVWTLLAVSSVPDDHGRPLRVVAQMHDVTELRAHRERLEELVATRTRELSAAKEEAERANRGKSQFLAHISHEIRNPLHIILGYAQILELDPTLGGAQQRQVGIVYSSGKHLLTLMDDLLEMAKIEARHIELVEHSFDPWATLGDIERMFGREAASKGIDIDIACAPELPRSIVGDGAKVKQILINLASNALKFTERGSIRFAASANAIAEGAIVVKIVVADTGIGMATHDAARIFEPFEQLDAGKRAGGTGLGLAISLGHARLMGGDLTVDSAPGAGSTFTFTFAATSVGIVAAPPARAPTTVVAADAARFKVLIVDDLAVNRDVLAELLAGPRFETRTVADGRGAIDIEAGWCPDLVLIDLRMPGMGGLEAIQRMRAAGSKAAIGALSASAVADDERQSLAFGADFFLAKPYDNRDLMDWIARVLETGPMAAQRGPREAMPGGAQPGVGQAALTE